MQANSQQSGQLQNLHGKGTTPGDGISNTLGQNFYHPCLPSHAASPSYPGQGATGNYLTHFTCTIQPTTSDPILSTKDSMPAQENPVTSEYILPTGKQDSQVILWNVPSNCQIFLPVNNLNLQGAHNNNGPNVSHCAFNSNNNVYMQQQNTSLAAGPNNSQHVKAKTMDTKSLNKSRHVNTINLLRRQRYANRPVLPKACFAKTTTEKPYELKSYPPTENAPHGHSSLFGYNYESLIPENSTHANLQTPSTCVQNIGAQRAVAVVTPLSPIGTESVNASDKSANMKMNVRSVQEIVRHQPNIPHALENNANLKNQNREPNYPINEHQRPKSVEPRLNYGLDNFGVKSPVSTDESLVSISSPKHKSVASEQKKSVPIQMENEPSEKMNDRTFTDKNTVEMETIPVIEWPLDRLDTLITVIQQIENRLQKNDQKTDAGRDIIKLYWNGDFRKFCDAVQSGFYQNIMEEAFVYCEMREPVILRQPKSDARNKVNKEFHVLKHNEEPPKMMYKSSWLNLNENVNDIDKDCGYSLVYKSFQNDPEHEAQISACKTQSNLQEATEKPSLPMCKRLPTEVENKLPAEEPTSNSESLNENLSILFNVRSPPVTNTNFSKCDCVVAEQTNSQPNITNSLEDVTIVKDSDVQTQMIGLDDQFCNDGSKSTEPCETSATMESNLIAASPDKDETSLNTSLVLDTISMKEQTSGQSAVNKPSLAEHNGLTDITNKVQIEEQTSLEKNLYNESLRENSPPVTDNCLLKLNLVKEQTSCQANSINPLNAMTNLVRTLKERDYLLRRHQSGLKRKPKPSTTTLRLNSSFCNGVEAKSPVLTSESSSTSPLTLSPVIEKQPPFVVLTRIQYESSDFDNHVRCEINPKPTQELSVQMDEGEMGALASIRINVLPPEVAEQYFAGQLTEDNDMAATPEVMHKASLMHTPQENDFTLTKEQMERLEEADGNLLKGYVVVEQTNCQSNTIHPLKAMTHLVMGVGEKRRTGKCEVLKNKHQPSTATSRLVDSFCNGAKSPTLTGSISQTDYASPPKLHPVTVDPSQIQLNKEMPEIDCMLTDEHMRCETDPKPSQELPVQINQEEIVKMDASASIRINVLPQEVAKLCFAGQLMEDQDITAPPEMMQKTSLLQTPQDTIPTKEQIHMWRLDEAIGNCSSKGNLVAEQTNCQSNIVHPLKAMTHLVMSFGKRQQTVKSEILKNQHHSANATRFYNQAKCSMLTTASTCQIDYRSPPKLHPVIAEPSPMQNELNEEMHEIDYMLTDESMRYETDSKPRQELTLNTNEQGTDKMDASDYIKINVLPHNMAEGWFAGEMKVKDSHKDLAVHITTEDQITFQVLEHMSEKEFLEDVKPKEGTCQSSGDEKLESYCCLAKWFQTLEYGDGASCMCQKKAELREETKIEVHGTNLALQTEKENPNELVELENSALEGTDDSETIEDEVPSRIIEMGDKKIILKDISSSEEVCKMETKISEQTKHDSPSECPTNVTNDVKQDTPTSDLTRNTNTNTISLTLYGSSSGRKEATQTKRFKGKDSCEEPPETLQVTIHSHQKITRKSKSKHEGVDDNLDSKLSANALSSTSIKKLLGPGANTKRSIHLGEGKKRKRLHKYSVKQMSMNQYVFRGKAVASKLLHSPDNVTKSKYELRNPALMPLDEGPSLEFKVLPESFNFEDGAVLGCTQAGMSQSTQNGMSGPQDKVKRMKISRSPTEGVWSFSPLKKKHTQPIQVTDASGSCSLFQEFKKRYCKKKEIASKLKSSEKMIS